MRRILSLATSSVLVLAALSACGPTGNGGGGGGGGNPPPLATNCALAPNQSSQQLTVNCTITGGLANVMFDPADSTNTGCTPFNPTGSNDLRDARLMTLSSQTISAPATLIYGAGGDDSEARVRVDLTLGSSTHTAQLGKTPTDCGVPGANVAVTTTFAGTHTALIDKGKTPMCVFQSRYTPASFSQVIGPGGPNVAFATQKATEAAIARQLDLQAARTVNGLLSPNADLTGSFVANSGRCEGDYQPFP